MADIVTSTGAKIYIGPAVTSAQADTLVEYQAMSTWVEIGLVESIAPFGDKPAAVTFAAINDSRMRKQKGIKDAGDVDVVVAHDPTDLGQIAMDAADAATSGYAFKVTILDSRTSAKFFRAYVMGAPINIGGSDNVIRRTYTLAIDSAIFTELH